MKLNLGSGFNKIEGYVNVDSAPESKPDQVVDLESLPWPWPDSSVDEMRFDHVMEHLGKDPKTYLGIWREIWRVAKPDAKIFVTVPHWRHDNFVHDPTHVRAVTPIGIAMFDQTRNIEFAKWGGQETKLGLMNHIDFALEKLEYVFVSEIQNALASGALSQEKAQSLLDHENNVCLEVKMLARAVKPGRGEGWTGV